jgi:hypothetical protein
MQMSSKHEDCYLDKYPIIFIKHYLFAVALSETGILFFRYMEFLLAVFVLMHFVAWCLDAAE